MGYLLPMSYWMFSTQSAGCRATSELGDLFILMPANRGHFFSDWYFMEKLKGTSTNPGIRIVIFLYHIAVTYS